LRTGVFQKGTGNSIGFRHKTRLRKNYGFQSRRGLTTLNNPDSRLFFFLLPVRGQIFLDMKKPGFTGQMYCFSSVVN
jgi:hypothetical protein